MGGNFQEVKILCILSTTITQKFSWVLIFVGADFCVKNWEMETTQFSSVIRDHHIFKEVQYGNLLTAKYYSVQGKLTIAF